MSGGNLNKISKHNTYAASDGTRYTQEEINNNIDLAKEEVKEIYLDQYGYLFCTDCKRNDCQPIEMSHTISIKWAKENGQVELCWSVENIKPRGHKCHAILDGLY